MFWDMKGPITIDFLEKGTTLNSSSYYQLFQQNSSYLLIDPHIYMCVCVGGGKCVCIGVYMYVYNYNPAKMVHHSIIFVKAVHFNWWKLGNKPIYS